jgi:hypothetical protein
MRRIHSSNARPRKAFARKGHDRTQTVLLHAKFRMNLFHFQNEKFEPTPTLRPQAMARFVP